MGINSLSEKTLWGPETYVVFLSLSIRTQPKIAYSVSRQAKMIPQVDQHDVFYNPPRVNDFKTVLIKNVHILWVVTKTFKVAGTVLIYAAGLISTYLCPLYNQGECFDLVLIKYLRPLPPSGTPLTHSHRYNIFLKSDCYTEITIVTSVQYYLCLTKVILLQRFRTSTRRRYRLENESPQAITPRTRTRCMLGRTPTKLYSPFGIETPQSSKTVGGKENKTCGGKAITPRRR